MRMSQYNRDQLTPELLQSSLPYKVFNSNIPYMVKLFNKANNDRSIATLKNVNESITSMALLIVLAKMQLDSKKKIIETFHTNPERVKNYTVTDEDKFSIYVPRPKDANYLQTKVVEPEYYINLFHKYEIYNFANFTIAQDMLQFLHIINLEIGGLLPDGTKVLSQVTINPLEQWNADFIKSIDSLYKISIVAMFGTKEYSDFYKKIFSSCLDSPVSMIKTKNEKYEIIHDKHVDNINNYNKNFPLTHNLKYYTRSYENVNDITHAVSHGRLYSEITHMSKQNRELIIKSENMIELDQTASKINKLYIINTGKTFDDIKHPVKEFIKYLLKKFDIQDQILFDYLYTVLKPIIITAVNTDINTFKYKIEKELVELGLYNTANDRYTAKKPYHDSLCYKFTTEFDKEELAKTSYRYLQNIRKSNFLKSIKTNTKLHKHDYKLYYKYLDYANTYKGNINISVDYLISSIESFFLPIKNFLWKSNWYIDEEIDYYYSIEILKFCKNYHIPYITVFDAFYVSKEFKDIASVFMKQATIKSVLNFKQQYNSDNEYIKHIQSSYTEISRTRIFHNLNTNGIDFRKFIISTYCTNYKNIKNITNHNNLDISNFYTNDIYFNKILDNKVIHYTKFITNYVNSINLKDIVSLYFMYSTNTRMINLNFNKIYNSIISDKYISLMKLHTFINNNHIKDKFFNTKTCNLHKVSKNINNTNITKKNSIITKSNPPPLLNIGGPLLSLNICYSDTG